MAQTIHEERCMHRRCMHRVVDGEFHYCQEFAPILERMDVTPKDFLKNAVCTFCLTSVSGWSEVDIWRRIPSVLNMDCQTSAVDRGSRSETSSRGNPWRRKIVSIKTRSHADALMDSGTATRCTILLNLSTNTRIPVFLCGSAGNPKTKSIETDSQHSAGMGKGCNGARSEGPDFTRWHTSHARTYLRTNWYWRGQ